MDKEIRGLWRSLCRTGQVEQFVVTCLEGMDRECKKRIFSMARFLYERELKLYGPIGDRVAVCFLSDEAIIDNINTPKLKSIRRDWASGHRHDRDRRVDDIILEEAEYRGLKTDEQLRWEALKEMTPQQRSHGITKSLSSYQCIERGGHRFMYDAAHQCHVCTNCRRRITDAEVMERVNRECAGRFR